MAQEENSYNNYEKSEKYDDYNDNYRANTYQPSNYENGYGYNNDSYGYNNNDAYGYNNNDAYGYNNNDAYGYKDKDKTPQIFPANKVSELGDRWWQWIASLNNITDVNPFTDTGQAGCDVGLQDDGRLLFLVGSPSDPPLSGTFPVHDCKIKEGTSILFPIVNVFCANSETDPPRNESETRKCANEAQDTAFDLQLEIDGKEIQNLERQYRVDSPPGGFEFTAVLGNPATSLLGSSIGVSDGVWILLKHLPPGEHTITFSGKFDFTGIIGGGEEVIVDAGATYNLDVIPKYY